MFIYTSIYMSVHIFICLFAIVKQKDELTALLSLILMFPFYNNVLDFL